MSDKPEFPPLPPGPGMISIDDVTAGKVSIDVLTERATKMIAAIEEIEANNRRELTLRDLYPKLQAQDEKYLDVPIWLVVEMMIARFNSETSKLPPEKRPRYF